MTAAAPELARYENIHTERARVPAPATLPASYTVSRARFRARDTGVLLAFSIYACSST